MFGGMRRNGWLVLAGFCALLPGCAREKRVEVPAAQIRPAIATAPVTDDADDPAIWVNPRDAAASLVFGTNKVKAPRGALVVFDLDGQIRQTVDGLDRPNNVDVEYGFLAGGKAVDIVVVTERLRSRLRVYRVREDGSGVDEIGAVPVFEGETGERSQPMGIALYKRPRDGAVFAIVSRKSGPSGSYLWQYRLLEAGGKIRGEKAREFGAFSGRAEIEAVAVDDELGYVYYADEDDSIRKYAADPEAPEPNRELARFATTGFKGNREGIAIYAQPGGAGYVICTEQIAGNSAYHLFPRAGAPGNPHDHSRVLGVIRGGADATDGLDATAAALGPKFPAGVLIAMNSGGKNFLFYRWEDIEAARR